MQCPTNQTNMSLISFYLDYLTEQRLEQDSPLTGYLQYILSEVVLKHEYTQCNLLLSFDCRSLNTDEVDVIEFTFDNRVLINDNQENEFITHISIVANKDYPSLLDIFVHANGLKILVQHFARNYPSIQSYDECLTSSSSSSNTNIFDKINFFDFSSLVSTSSSL
ncbi:unnamed protein product [Rotaria sordida]|uniref:Uncharacterized protein n=1 Tax=Rotaria sordida TaxID=392033 RepID=A0A814I0W4_9BILA|nr:unnamed protein product [Rotaria sordida]CAF3691881.1 unnamed protein product [Rotaria sordida]